MQSLTVMIRTQKWTSKMHLEPAKGFDVRHMSTGSGTKAFNCENTASLYIQKRFCSKTVQKLRGKFKNYAFNAAVSSVEKSYFWLVIQSLYFLLLHLQSLRPRVCLDIKFIRFEICQRRVVITANSKLYNVGSNYCCNLIWQSAISMLKVDTLIKLKNLYEYEQQSWRKRYICTLDMNAEFVKMNLGHKSILKEDEHIWQSQKKYSPYSTSIPFLCLICVVRMNNIKFTKLSFKIFVHFTRFWSFASWGPFELYRNVSCEQYFGLFSPMETC